MRTGSAWGQCVAVFLGVALVACGGSTLHVAPNESGLSRHVLVIREHSDGTVTHSWESTEGFDLPRQATRSRLRTEQVVSRPRDCDEENRQCVSECMSRPLARGFGHITTGGRKLGGKKDFCVTQCRQPYLDCMELERLRPQEFAVAGEAVDWVKRHRSEILLGSVLVIAGTVFVVVSMGAGVLILAPAVLLATAGTDVIPFNPEVEP